MIAQGGTAIDIGTDEVAPHQVGAAALLTGRRGRRVILRIPINAANDCDAVAQVARQQVAALWRLAADEVVVRPNQDTAGAIAQRFLTAGIRTNEVAGQRVFRYAAQRNPFPREAIDDQTVQRAAAQQGQAACFRRGAAVHLDQQGRRPGRTAGAGLRQAVDDDRIAHIWKSEGRRNRMDAGARDRKMDLIGQAIVGVIVGRLNCLAQRALHHPANPLALISRAVDDKNRAFLGRVLALHRAHVAAKTGKARQAALIKLRATRVRPHVYGWAAQVGRMRQGRPAIGLQGSQLGIEGKRIVANLVAIHPIHQNVCTTGVVADQIVRHGAP